jgi:ABC-type Fe3+ transport system permease subunit
MGEAFRTYHTELAQSAGVALAGGVVAVAMGMSLAAAQRVRRASLIGTLLFGALPAALVGEAVLVACQPFAALYDYWPLLVIGYVARYAWVGLLAAWLASVSIGHDVIAQARTDGAGEVTVLLRMAYAPNAVLLLCGVAVVSAWSLADVAIGSLLQVPSIGLISLKLIEKFHRFEDGMLASLSLWLAAGAVPAAVLFWLALRGRRALA